METPVTRSLPPPPPMSLLLLQIAVVLGLLPMLALGAVASLSGGNRPGGPPIGRWLLVGSFPLALVGLAGSFVLALLGFPVAARLVAAVPLVAWFAAVVVFERRTGFFIYRHARPRPTGRRSASGESNSSRGAREP